MDRIKELISKMTLEEKASLCSGADNWHTKEIKRLNIPSVMMVDGPHGLRKQEGETDHLGLNESVKAVCFPEGYFCRMQQESGEYRIQYPLPFRTGSCSGYPEII